MRIDTEFCEGSKSRFERYLPTYIDSWWTVTLQSLSLMAGKKNKLAVPSIVGMRK